MGKRYDDESTEKSAECEWFEAAADWCVGWSKTVLLTMPLKAAQTSPTLEPEENISTIHCDIILVKTLLTVIN